MLDLKSAIDAPLHNAAEHSRLAGLILKAIPEILTLSALRYHGADEPVK